MVMHTTPRSAFFTNGNFAVLNTKLLLRESNWTQNCTVQFNGFRGLSYPFLCKQVKGRWKNPLESGEESFPFSKSVSNKIYFCSILPPRENSTWLATKTRKNPWGEFLPRILFQFSVTERGVIEPQIPRGLRTKSISLYSRAQYNKVVLITGISASFLYDCKITQS